MISIERCKIILQKHGKNYTDEQVKAIRQNLYSLGILEYQLFKSLKEKQDGKCNSIRKG